VFKEIISVYSEKHTKPINTKYSVADCSDGWGIQLFIVQEAGWAPEPVWTQRIEEKSFLSAEDRTPIARLSSP
jgi:hypothetical protein